jgi:hypothetical protein
MIDRMIGYPQREDLTAAKNVTANLWPFSTDNPHLLPYFSKMLTKRIRRRGGFCFIGEERRKSAMKLLTG